MENTPQKFDSTIELRSYKRAVDLQTQVATLQNENLLMLNFVKEIKRLVGFNNSCIDEKITENYLQHILDKVNELAALKTQEAEELSKRRNAMQRVLELCKNSDIKELEDTDPTCNEIPIGVSSKTTNIANFNICDSVCNFDTLNDAQQMSSLLLEPENLAEENDELEETSLCNNTLSNSPTINNTSNENINNNAGTHTHEAVDIDPLYSDPRKPDAKLFACKCGSHYFSSSALGLHIITMKFGNVYTCQYCLKGFRHFHKLKKHVNDLHEKPFNLILCGFCRKHFKTQGSLKKHLLSKHDG